VRLITQEKNNNSPDYSSPDPRGYRCAGFGKVVRGMDAADIWSLIQSA